APIWLNIVLIIFIMFGDTALNKTYYLSYALLVAGVIEMLWVYQLIYKRFGYLSVFKISVTADIKRLLQKMLPGIFGSGITQINLMITTILCSFIPSGISFLYYADRISQLPLALLGTALGTVLLPALSKKSQALNKFKAIQSKAYIFALFISLPTSALLIGLSQEIVGLLFEHGSFDHTATLETAAVLAVFAVALPMFILIKILTSCFFALGDTKTPVMISAISLPINICVGLVSLPFMRHVGIAFASVVSSYFIVITLSYMLNKKGCLALYTRTIKQSLKIIAVSLTMLPLVYALKFYISEHAIFIKLAICGAVCLVFYLISNRYFIGINIRKFIKS
ncbi:MAG: lipid II flippase MurJ, partial [Alphaproteobacteria bacterium]